MRAPSAEWLTLAELERDPHPALARLRHETPVAWVPALNGWLITTRALVNTAMRDDVGLTVDDPRFSTGQITGPSMLSTDGVEHARHRQPFARPFRLDAVRERFTATAQEESARLVRGFAGDGNAELRTALAAPLAARMMLHALGLPPAAESDTLAWYTTIVDAVTRITAGEPVPTSGRDAYDALGAAILNALDGGDPSTSLLAAALADAASLTNDELVANAAVLLFGGIETTEGMISNLLHHLAATPDLLVAAGRDESLLDGAIEESLRLEPAAAVVDRYATRDVALGGVTIPTGDLVVVSLAAANRDPDVFTDPDTFDPLRANAKLHTTFATGPHVCLGMHLARLEARAAITAVVRELPGVRGDAERSRPPRGLVFRKPPEVRVVWDA